MAMHLLVATLLSLPLTAQGVTWQLGTRQPNRPEAEVCGIARDYLLPSHTAYQNLEQLATLGTNGQASLISVRCMSRVLVSVRFDAASTRYCLFSLAA